MGKFNFSGLIEKLKEKLGKGKSPPEIPDQNKPSTPNLSERESKGTNKNILSDQALINAFDPSNRPFWHKIFITVLIASISYIFGSLIATKLVTIIVPKKTAPSFDLKTLRKDSTIANLNTIKKINI